VRRLEGLYVQFSERLDPEANARIQALCDRLLADLFEGWHTGSLPSEARGSSNNTVPDGGFATSTRTLECVLDGVLER
jgi:hypothetical protein